MLDLPRAEGHYGFERSGGNPVDPDIAELCCTLRELGEVTISRSAADMPRNPGSGLRSLIIPLSWKWTVVRRPASDCGEESEAWLSRGSGLQLGILGA